MNVSSLQTNVPSRALFPSSLLLAEEDQLIVVINWMLLEDDNRICRFISDCLVWSGILGWLGRFDV